MSQYRNPARQSYSATGCCRRLGCVKKLARETEGPPIPPGDANRVHSGLLPRHDSHPQDFSHSWRDSLPGRRLKVMPGFGSPTNRRAASDEPFHRVSLAPVPTCHVQTLWQTLQPSRDLQDAYIATLGRGNGSRSKKTEHSAVAA